MDQSTLETNPAAASPPSPVTLHQLVVDVGADTPVVAFTPLAGVQLHLGNRHACDASEAVFVIAAPSPAELVQLLSRAITAVVAADPTADPAPGPDPRIVEAHGILLDDVARLLGIPKNGLPVDIEEIGVSDIRAARRLLQRSLDLVNEAIVDAIAPARALRAVVGA